MNLLVFTQTLDRSDAVQGFAHEWFDRLSEKLDELHVIANRVGEHDLADNVQVESLGAEEGRSRIVKLGTLWNRTYRILSTGDLDGIFVHQIEHYGLATWPLARYFGVPVVQFKAHRGVPVTLWLAGWMFDWFVTSSEGGLELETDRMTVLGQGINTDRFCPDSNREPDETFRILSVGRLSPVKDYETLIAALARLQSRMDSPWQTRVVGGPATESDQVYAQNLKHRTRELGLEDRVTWSDPVPNHRVHELYRWSDVVVNLSHTGSLDKAVLEAMSSGCPVVTSNWAFREILPEDLQNRLVVEPEHDSQLTDCLVTLAQTPPSLRRQLGEQLRSIVTEHHDLNGFLEGLIEVFRGLGSPGPSPDKTRRGLLDGPSLGRD